MILQAYGGWVCNPYTGKVLKGDGTEGPPWWMDFPTFPSSKGLEVLRASLAKVSEFAEKKSEDRIDTSTGNPRYLIVYKDVGVKEEYVIDAGYELNLLAREGENQWLVAIKQNINTREGQ